MQHFLRIFRFLAALLDEKLLSSPTLFESIFLFFLDFFNQQNVFSQQWLFCFDNVYRIEAAPTFNWELQFLRLTNSVVSTDLIAFNLVTSWLMILWAK